MNALVFAKEHFWKATVWSFRKAEQEHMSITLDGITFRWDGQDVWVTTAASQRRITSGSAARLLDFLLLIQQDLYAVEQACEMPMWAHLPRQLVNGGVSEEQLLDWMEDTTIPTCDEVQVLHALIQA